MRLQRLSNTCVRYIYGVGTDVHFIFLRRRLGCLRVDSRRLYLTAIIVYKVLRMGQSSYLRDFFTLHQSMRPQRGERKELSIPFVRTEMGYRIFQIQGRRFLNQLPEALRILPSIHIPVSNDP